VAPKLTRSHVRGPGASAVSRAQVYSKCSGPSWQLPPRSACQPDNPAAAASEAWVGGRDPDSGATWRLGLRLSGTEGSLSAPGATQVRVDLAL
jgi:hypothetical protein